MGRLIDGDALLKNIRRAIYPSEMTTTIAVGICESHVEDMPTVDAIPVDWLVERLQETAEAVARGEDQEYLNQAIFTVLVYWEGWKKLHAAD